MTEVPPEVPPKLSTEPTRDSISPTTRIPNFFHLLLFLALTFFAFILVEIAAGLLHPHTWQTALADPRIQTIAEMATYIVALAAAYLVFPHFWHRPALAGIAWNPSRAHLALIPAGLVLSLLIEGADSLLPAPRHAPIEQIFKTPGVIWILTAFGVLLAPLFEEILFRGFLLPAIAIAFDYLSLPRSTNPAESLATLARWRASEAFTRQALVFASIVASVFFALIHAPQLAYYWPSVGLLAMVSLIFCFVRIRLNSVAASTLMHASYNLTLFAAAFIATGGYRHMDKL